MNTILTTEQAERLNTLDCCLDSMFAPADIYVDKKWIGLQDTVMQKGRRTYTIMELPDGAQCEVGHIEYSGRYKILDVNAFIDTITACMEKEKEIGQLSRGLSAIVILPFPNNYMDNPSPTMRYIAMQKMFEQNNDQS